jgi:hypothetical protein
MKTKRNDEISSFKNLYYLVGILGFSLPFLCLLGLLISMGLIPRSSAAALV